MIPSQSYGASLVIWDHTVLQSTCLELGLRYMQFELQHLFRVNRILFCGQSRKVQVKTVTNHCTIPESQKKTDPVSDCGGHRLLYTPADTSHGQPQYNSTIIRYYPKTRLAEARLV